jgi:hypothetical protein
MREIDFRPKNSDLDKITFKVALVGIQTINNYEFIQGEFLNSLPINDYKAVVNIDTNQILSVVSKNYRLIKNQEALNIGKKVFSKLFPSVSENDWKIFKVISPLKGTFCHIDLIHEDVNLKTWDQDVWYPFLRVTNSYNKTFALTFELGFVRKLCSNGVIFSKKTVKVKFNHNQSNLTSDIEVDVSDLKVLEEDFKKKIYNLSRFYVPKKYTFAMLIKATGISFNTDSLNKKIRDNEIQKQQQLNSLTYELADQYVANMGENALAAFNTITDIISNQDKYKLIPNYSLSANRYYHNISSWMKEYTEEAEKRDFSLDRYLEKESKYIQ